MARDFPSYETLVAAVNQVLDNAKGENLTLRQIYYKLVVMKLFENVDSNYKLLSAHLVKARERGDVDDNRIEDRKRQIIGGDCSLRSPVAYYQDHEDAFRNCWKQYARPSWLDQTEYVEIWVEKDSLSKVAASAAGEYNVTTCVGHGYSSYSYVNKAVERILRNCGTRRDEDGTTLLRRPTILYFGDMDPSGHNMVEDLENRLRKYGLALPESYKIVQKIAITNEQIKQLDLPTIPVSTKKQKSDTRAKKYIAEFGLATVELDTLDSDTLKTMIRDAIEQHIDGTIWNEHFNASEKERQAMKLMIDEHFKRSE